MIKKSLFVKAIIYTSHDCMGKERSFFIDADYNITDSAKVIKEKITHALVNYMGCMHSDIEEITYISVL